MAISGLVLTLDEREDLAEAAIAALAADRRLVLGERFGRRLVVVAETDRVQADRDLWDDLRLISGVHHVDVAFIDFDANRAESAGDGERAAVVEDAHAQR